MHPQSSRFHPFMATTIAEPLARLGKPWNSDQSVTTGPWNRATIETGLAKPELLRNVRNLIVAAGGIVLREGQVLLVHRPRYGDWSFPKGKLDDGESPLETALREVREETGWTCQAVQFLGAFGYEVKGTPKVVLYWEMEPLQEGKIEDTREVSELRWIPVSQAPSLLSYPLEKELLARASGN